MFSPARGTQWRGEGGRSQALCAVNCKTHLAPACQGHPCITPVRERFIHADEGVKGRCRANPRAPLKSGRGDLLSIQRNEEQSRAPARSPAHLQSPILPQGRHPKPIGMPVRALLLFEVFQIDSAKPFPPQTSAPRAGSDARSYGALWDAESGQEWLGTATKGWRGVIFLPSSPPAPDFGG